MAKPVSSQDACQDCATTFRAPSALLLALEARALVEWLGSSLMQPVSGLTKEGDGHSVIVIPGLLASDASTAALRSFLADRNYAVSGWNQGHNRGLRPGVEPALRRMVLEQADRSGRRVSLVGWSLGGMYARHLAHVLSDEIRCVVTLAAPFAGAPDSTNVSKLYEFVSGHSTDEARAQVADLVSAPQVPTTSIYTRSDGVCAWKACYQPPGPLAESVRVAGSHCGLAANPIVAYVVADRLSQPEGAWRRFERPDWRDLLTSLRRRR